MQQECHMLKQQHIQQQLDHQVQVAAQPSPTGQKGLLRSCHDEDTAHVEMKDRWIDLERNEERLWTQYGNIPASEQMASQTAAHDNHTLSVELATCQRRATAAASQRDRARIWSSTRRCSGHDMRQRSSNDSPRNNTLPSNRPPPNSGASRRKAVTHHLQ